MAARRLLIVMLVLLGISSIIAIVVPEPSQRDSDPPETAATGETGATGASGNTGATGATGEDGDSSQGGPRVAHETVTLDGKGKEVELEARPGSRMILTVDSKEGEVVEIEGLGLTGFADRYAPAVFDIYLPGDPGRYAVGAAGAKPVATIVTREPPPA